MTEQLALIETPPPPLTPRQQHVADALHQAGHDGLTAAQAGAYVHAQQGRHAEDRPCDWCTTAGNEILKALRKRGLARQRGRPRIWVAVDAKPDAAFGELPKGF
jgi:hypothetical protein